MTGPYAAAIAGDNLVDDRAGSASPPPTRS